MFMTCVLKILPFLLFGNFMFYLFQIMIHYDKLDQTMKHQKHTTNVSYSQYLYVVCSGVMVIIPFVYIY